MTDKHDFKAALEEVKYIDNPPHDNTDNYETRAGDVFAGYGDTIQTALRIAIKYQEVLDTEEQNGK